MSTGFSLEVRQTVIGRALGRCEFCYVQPGAQMQHRVARAMGGSRNTPWINLPSNAGWLCGTSSSGCHGRCEQRDPALAGWWVVRGEAEQAGGPAGIKVPDVGGYWWWLTDGGLKLPALPGMEPVL